MSFFTVRFGEGKREKVILIGGKRMGGKKGGQDLCQKRLDGVKAVAVIIQPRVKVLYSGGEEKGLLIAFITQTLYTD